MNLTVAERARELIREGKSAEEVLRQTLVEHIRADKFNNELEIIDLKWYKGVIDDDIKHQVSRENIIDKLI